MQILNLGVKKSGWVTACRENRGEQQRNVATWQDLMFVCNVKKTVWWNWWLCHHTCRYSYHIACYSVFVSVTAYFPSPLFTVLGQTPHASAVRHGNPSAFSPEERKCTLLILAEARRMLADFALTTWQLVLCSIWCMFEYFLYKEPKCDRLHVTRSVTRAKKNHVHVKLMTGYVIHGLLRLSGI